MRLDTAASAIMAMALCCGLSVCAAESRGTLRVDLGKPGHPVAPSMYGIFFEEINHAADGGVYAELIQNRSFEESLPPEGTKLEGDHAVALPGPHYQSGKNKDWRISWKFNSPHPAWSVAGGATASVEAEKPLNENNARYLRLQLKGPGGKLVNEGYWGINVREGETYRLSFFARTAGEFKGGATAQLESADGRVLAKAPVESVASAEWKKFTCELKSSGSDSKARFALMFDSTGTLDVDVVSLFPARTYKDRPNGLRPDVAELLAGLKPAFVRFPGGCYVEGCTLENRYQWKKTIGPIETRPGHWCLWNYRSTDGMGYHEFLQFCEDIGAKALYVSNCGLSCEFRHGSFQPAEKLDEFIQDGLDAVEYAIGPADSKWGAQRVANGHPQPFPLQYFQIGNENHGPRYKEYYQRVYKVMKEKYPQLQYVYCCGCGWADDGMVRGAGKIELADEHFYRNPDWFFNEYRRYDQTPRGHGFELYVGEYACNSQVGRGNMLAALSEAAFMLGMERNGDIVKMTSYAPLLFNVNRLDWPVNLIGYDSSRAFGRSSYYVQKLFSVNRPDVNLSTELVMAEDGSGGPRFAGKIGLGAWDTDVEYKDLVVLKDDKPVYTADFAANTNGWKAHEGSSSSVAEGAYRLTGSVPRRFALLEKTDFDAFTLKVKARKIKGGEGFLILFGAKGPQEFQELNLGGWGNKEHAFESVQNGEGTPHGNKARGQIEAGRWYDIKLVVNAKGAIGYLDGKEISRYHFATEARVYAQAGYDKQAGEVVLKAVNATAQAASLQVKLESGAPDKEGRLILLAATKPGEENDVEVPTRIAPKESAFAVPGSEFPLNLEPWSMIVLRIPAKLP